MNSNTGKMQKMGVIPQKFHPIAHNPEIKVSEKCCDIMKKNPVKIYEKETGRSGFVGMMANENCKCNIKLR